MEKNSITQRQIITTEDGSSSLKLCHFNEQFHSIHGAMRESMHIFINTGLKSFSQRRISVFEMGFGTGLNALLTLLYSMDKQVDYYAIEAFPLNENEYLSLNYVDLVYAQTKEFSSFSKKELHDFFLTMHQSESGKTVQITPNFHFNKEIIRLEDKIFKNQIFDIVYFDAFSPETQPELWEYQIFEKIYAAMSKGGVLITYCAKGVVKRTLKKIEFTVESLPGTVGKREIIRVVK